MQRAGLAGIHALRLQTALGVALGCALLAPRPGFAEWKVVTNDQDVEVSEQPVAGRGLAMFRGIGTVAGTPDEILDVLQDVADHPKWMPDCAEARVVSGEPNDLVVYRRSAAPWPVSDRDVLVKSHTEIVKPGVEINAFFEAVDDPNFPARSDAVRMPHLVGHWKILAIDKDSSRVEYEVDADPGGQLPAWIASTASRSNPVRTIVGLRARVAAARSERGRHTTE